MEVYKLLGKVSWTDVLVFIAAFTIGDVFVLLLKSLDFNPPNLLGYAIAVLVFTVYYFKLKPNG